MLPKMNQIISIMTRRIGAVNPKRLCFILHYCNRFETLSLFKSILVCKCTYVLNSPFSSSDIDVFSKKTTYFPHRFFKAQWSESVKNHCRKKTRLQNFHVVHLIGDGRR